MIIMSIKDLALSFGANDIFGDISFDLKSSMCLGLIGSNGSGKTSLLKILSGDLEKSSGHIKKASNISINYLSQLSDYTSTSENLKVEDLKRIEILKNQLSMKYFLVNQQP